MSLLPPTGSLIPVDAPFSAAQESWLAGFIAGIAAAGKKVAASAPTTTIDVLFGTQTGNAEFLADELVAGAKARGLGGRASALDAVTPEQLAEMSHVLVVTSTYGEGEMPDNAGLFWDAIQASTVPRLEGLQYAVLGLGDTSYDEFCQAGKLLDTRFEQLGATRIHDRVDCDVDFEDPAALWTAAVLDRLAAEAGATAAPGATTGGGAGDGAGATGGAGASRASRPGSQWNKRNPYPSRLVENRLLSSPRSAKEIRHYEFDLGDSGIEYAAGDALAVVPINDEVFVADLLEQVGANGGEAFDGRPITEVLRTDREIRTPSKDLIADLVQRAPSSELAAVVAHGDKHELDRWLWGRDVLDLLRDAGPAAPGLDELLPNLRPLQARQYSISSSPLAHPDRIHLTIASVRYGDPHRMYAGVASTFLADRVDPDGTVDVYLQPNASFGVPADESAPMIMIGPGTGVAPFRGFLHERAVSGATGRNWLFFGDQHRDTDFVYQDELTELQEQGVLDRLDLAFSRDQAEKVYVQTRMLERSAELFAWLEDGGHVYVCGDASRMAKDVEAALLQVIRTGRGRGEDDAQAYLADMRRAKRYVRDVY
ncbi:sulfite reductase subunit alpha [Curtobacterium flaccumfaciens]|uniref:sulfite reductase subunit alpha n=1 Tax=Curtobacterium flaccumfaciens TaxID=2035 RepID=UPI001BDF5DB0|nr:sulfite reductase subunit alpha [Curtobacterium flaccumfaciens]MBT1607560.1 sulfite reductase subunit alpha [Curtobacterium flaccumfaciens pv. betae]MBT1657645.1 sulfite reductase subunit alpha [Curtobacterium flaccumfaciens pv. betae]MCS0471944.1 sulfite reductase subunit alpha [Curtobacterium flaccumfaciens pv. betae]MCS0474697.1 sulfite reductase subunit alpha [Curtobacterium flaccumfaciens pv. betae]MCS0478357.1 sulfite reductase subunit alpha [Curtobacterium flaccumfaciens pv. betae]